jgi:transitional endoplasmic reticulum ATPase
MKRRRRRIFPKPLSLALEVEVEDQFQFLRELWILRILLKTRAHRDFIRYIDYEDDHFLLSVPILQRVNENTTDLEVLTLLRFRLKKMEANQQPILPDCTLVRNIRKLGSSLRLTKVEETLLTFVVAVKSDESLNAVSDRIGELNTSGFITVLATVLHCPKNEIQEALNNDSTLRAAGLLKIENGTHHFTLKVELIDHLEDYVFQPDLTTEGLLGRYFVKCELSDLSEDDFTYKANDLSVLLPFLKSAYRNNIIGINVLVWGQIGVGKNELVSVIAKSMNVPLYQIKFENTDGEPLSENTRLSSLRLCQTFLKHTGDGMALCDECEDLLEPHHYFFQRDDGRKGYLNRVLESNPVITFWLCNEINFNLSYKRRFTYSIHLTTPPTAIRRRMLENALKQHSIQVGTEWIQQTSKNEKLTPALISLSAEVASLTIPDCHLPAEQIMNRTINNQFELLGISERVGHTKPTAIPYRVEFVNADVDVETLIMGIRKNERARLLLQGSSGTGKTNLVEYVAERLNKPLLKKRASDILNMWVGSTEKNIRNAFRQAEESKSILLFDEVDSLLRPRESAHNGWEVTQVNELLVGLAEFNGMLFCCTNSRVEDLDPASVRRFDLKLTFTCLNPDQKWQLFQEICNVQVKDDLELEQKVRNLQGITIGDFSTVVRQNELLGNRNARTVYDALLLECEMKPDNNKGIVGFRLETQT